jgi:hypothetical protein
MIHLGAATLDSLQASISLRQAGISFRQPESMQTMNLIARAAKLIRELILTALNPRKSPNLTLPLQSATQKNAIA